VTVGVVTHLDEHVAVALDQFGRYLDALSLPTTDIGYARLLGWADSLGRLERVGIEGAGSFGARLSRFLRSRGVEVLEVDRSER
jgi:transposase